MSNIINYFKNKTTLFDKVCISVFAIFVVVTMILMFVEYVNAPPPTCADFKEISFKNLPARCLKYYNE